MKRRKIELDIFLLHAQLSKAKVYQSELENPHSSEAG